MIGGNGREHADREALRERLSAYLDGELAPGDAAALERHLASCAECRDELADLREVRALLRALPRPVLPRSFVLPPTATRTESHAAHLPPAARPLPTRARRAAAPASVPALARAAQWVGGLAACFGLLLIVATAVLGGAGGHASTTAGSSAAPHAPFHTTTSPQQSATQQSASATATVIARTPGAAQGFGPATHTASPPGTATNGPAETNNPPHALAASAEPFPVLPATGAGLLAGGIVLLGAGSVAARRRQRRGR